VILEAAILNIRPGKRGEFESAFAKAQTIITSIPGYLSHQLQRCIENADQYILLVKWETLESHTVGFRGSEQYQEWKALLHHFYDPLPEVYHYERVPGAGTRLSVL
jgi:heme-degrading monooxygenase HmoA